MIQISTLIIGKLSFLTSNDDLSQVQTNIPSSHNSPCFLYSRYLYPPWSSHQNLWTRKFRPLAEALPLDILHL